MILAYKIGYKDWAYLVPMIQSNLDHSPVPSLGNRAPVELFTGLQCPTPLMEFYLPDGDGLQDVPASDQIDNYLANLRSSLQMMHCDVENRRLKQRLLNKKRERGGNLVNFAEGDYVLRSHVDEKHGNKLQVTWVGPYRVVRADSHSFRVEHLVTGEQLDVHASRLKMYADESLNITDELLEHVAAQGIILAVNELKDHRWNAAINDYEIRVSWKGMQAIEDSYEPVQSLVKEIRVLVDNYVSKAKDSMLTVYLQKLQGGTAETDVVPPSKHSRPTSVPRSRVSANTASPAPTRKTNKKRRRQDARDVTGGGSQESSTNATQSMAVTSTWKRKCIEPRMRIGDWVTTPGSL
ncbi:hypothetical protein PF010_g26396 [Phytophthora fragariae]|uniref:Chromo domain-containing protein n=2 Tax=Phytophthora fragariae TaxID=53985 RepID=A0A6G0JXT2_9STRA|nr:hypothetical protein PF010_g26396 [Phytophthora fragariae]KAE9179885.1 hypothetical protein PF004_g25006 [Phytophthora fragariae]